MRKDKPDVIDAEFEVIEPPKTDWRDYGAANPDVLAAWEERQPPKPKWSPWPWDYDWYIDWRVFAVVALGSLAALIAKLTEHWRL